MGDDEMSQKRKVAVVAGAHAAVANAIATTYLLLDISKESWIDRNEEGRKCMASMLCNDHNHSDNFPIGVDAFQKLCGLNKEQGFMCDSRNSSLEEMVTQFIPLLGHNVRRQMLEGRVYRSQEIINRHLNETLNCMVKLYKSLVADNIEAVYGRGTPLQISSDLCSGEHFKGCVGLLDGRQVDASVPVEEQDKFQGRNSEATQNVITSYFFDLKSTCVLAGWEGVTHDHGVLKGPLVRSSPSIIPSEMENDSDSSTKTEDKKGQLRWNMTMDSVLLDKLVEAAMDGKRHGKKWDKSVWDIVIGALLEKTNESVRKGHIENRLRQMRSEFTNFVELKNKKGASYDPIKQTVLMSDDFWKDALSNPKAKKKFKAFRERGLKWDFEKLSVVLGNPQTPGCYSMSGADDMEKINVEEECTDLLYSHGQGENLSARLEKNESQHFISQGEARQAWDAKPIKVLPLQGEPHLDVNFDNTTNLEDGEESMSSESTKKRHSSHSKRQPVKKSRIIDEVKDVFEGVTTHLEKLRETVDPLSFGRQLHAALMGVDGFSHKYLNAAFRLLMKDRSEAEIFLCIDEDGRKDILKNLGGQIGDI